MGEGTKRTTLSMVELEDARDMMELAAAALERWQRRLESVARELPEPAYEADTDEPRNLAAAWQGQLEALVQDELAPAIAALRKIATWTEEQERWRGDSTGID